MLQRYYLETGTKNPKVSTAGLAKTLHALYTDWIRQGAHPRDFSTAVAHEADGIYAEFLMAGSPSFTVEEMLDVPLPVLPLAVPRKAPLNTPALRFFDEVGINPDIDTSKHRPALAPHFLRWVGADVAPRDFTQAVRDAAEVVVYDHAMCESLGGLGGGKTGLQFLTTDYVA